MHFTDFTEFMSFLKAFLKNAKKRQKMFGGLRPGPQPDPSRTPAGLQPDPSRARAGPQLRATSLAKQTASSAASLQKEPSPLKKAAYAPDSFYNFDNEFISGQKKLPVDISQRQFFPDERDMPNMLARTKARYVDKTRGDINTLRDYCRKWEEEGHNVHLRAAPQNVSSCSIIRPEAVCDRKSGSGQSGRPLCSNPIQLL